MEIIRGLVTHAVLVIILNTSACPFSLVLFSCYDNEEDFRRTACTSLLQHVDETSRQRRDGAEDEEQNASDGNGRKMNEKCTFDSHDPALDKKNVTSSDTNLFSLYRV